MGILPSLAQLVPSDLVGYNEVDPGNGNALVVTHSLELYHELYRRIGAEDQIAFGLPGPMVIGIAMNRSRRERLRDRHRPLHQPEHSAQALRAHLRAAGRPQPGGCGGSGAGGLQAAKGPRLDQRARDPAAHRLSAEHPFGDLDENRLHAWQFEHRDDNADEADAITAAGAYVMGRNMFGPDRGEWDLDWTGWWGPNPVYHAPVFVLSHRPRRSVEMEGGTTYHFVTDGIEAALEQARDAAGDKNVSISGGLGTLNQYLAAGLVDELRLHVAPFVAGGGERVFDGVGNIELTPVSSRTTPHVTHLVYRR